MDDAQEIIREVVGFVELLAEALGALMVAVGLVVVIYHGLRAWLLTHERSFRWTRVQLSQYLVLALEFQLAADILATAIAPSWEELGKLAVIATIRTGLNYFLHGEIREMEQQQQPSQRAANTP